MHVCDHRLGDSLWDFLGGRGGKEAGQKGWCLRLRILTFIRKRQAGADLKCFGVGGIPFLPRSVGKWMWIHLMRIFLQIISSSLCSVYVSVNAKAVVLLGILILGLTLETGKIFRKPWLPQYILLNWKKAHQTTPSFLNYCPDHLHITEKLTWLSPRNCILHWHFKKKVCVSVLKC